MKNIFETLQEYPEKFKPYIKRDLSPLEKALIAVGVVAIGIIVAIIILALNKKKKAAKMTSNEMLNNIEDGELGDQIPEEASENHDICDEELFQDIDMDKKAFWHFKK